MVDFLYSAQYKVQWRSCWKRIVGMKQNKETIILFPCRLFIKCSDVVFQFQFKSTSSDGLQTSKWRKLCHCIPESVASIVIYLGENLSEDWHQIVGPQKTKMKRLTAINWCDIVFRLSPIVHPTRKMCIQWRDFENCASETNVLPIN